MQYGNKGEVRMGVKGEKKTNGKRVSCYKEGRTEVNIYLSGLDLGFVANTIAQQAQVSTLS